MDVRAYRFEENALRDIYENLKGGGLTVTLWQDTAIEGTVLAEEPGLFFTSIPYDKGWTVTVDGEEVEGRKVIGAFLGFDLPAGKHEIQFRYYPPGMKMGILVSASSLLCILFLIWKENKQRPTRPVPEEVKAVQDEGQEAAKEDGADFFDWKKKENMKRQVISTNLDWLDDDIDSEADWDSWMIDDIDSEKTNE